MAIDLTPWAVSGELIAPHVPIPAARDDADMLEIVMCVDVPISHYEGGGDGTIGLNGGLWWVHPCAEETVVSWQVQTDQVHIQSSERTYVVPYQRAH